MTSVKLKFKPSATPGKEGALVFQLTHRRSVRRMASEYKIFAEEWNAETEQVVIPPSASPRHEYLACVKSGLQWELDRLKRIVKERENSAATMNLDEVAADFSSCAGEAGSVFGFIRLQIQRKRQTGKVRSSETYRSTLNSFMDFRKGIDLTFDRIDRELVEQYEAKMRSQGLTRNTTSFYMRILRTNYKMAVEKGLTPDRRPFRHVYCGIDKTVKRSITFEEIKRVKRLELSEEPVLDFARDMFILSFCMRGMSFVDMAYLKKKDLKNGYFVYRRKKTGQMLTVEWTRQMQEILEKYRPNPTQYLFPVILREDGTERRQYQNQMLKVNRHLKEVARMAHLQVPLSLYYSRHSWATIARGKDIPLAVISEGLGHDSETTTLIYLDSIKSYEVDQANRKILNDL